VICFIDRLLLLTAVLDVFAPQDAFVHQLLAEKLQELQQAHVYPSAKAMQQEMETSNARAEGEDGQQGGKLHEMRAVDTVEQVSTQAVGSRLKEGKGTSLGCQMVEQVCVHEET